MVFEHYKLTNAASDKVVMAHHVELAECDILSAPPMLLMCPRTIQEHAASMGGSSKAAERALQAGKWELRRSLVAELQAELLTGAELLPSSSQFAAAAQMAAATVFGSACGAISSSTVTVFTTPVILVNASACYQAAYK